MRVRVLPSPEHLDDVAATRWKMLHELHNDYFLFPGREFTVYGLRFADNDVWFLLHNPTGYLQEVSSIFFDVVDRRVSGHWVFRSEGLGARLFPPDLMDDPYFIDALGDLEPSYVHKWATLQKMLDGEALSAVPFLPEEP
jgi:hypothetical protein